MVLRPKITKLFLLLLHDAAVGSVCNVDETASVAILNGIFASSDRLTRFCYQFLLSILEWIPTILSGHFSIGRFSKLSAAQRQAHMETMRTSKRYIRRAFFKAILVPVWICHYARSEVQLQLGYDSHALTATYQGGKDHND